MEMLIAIVAIKCLYDYAVVLADPKNVRALALVALVLTIVVLLVGWPLPLIWRRV